jgi:hypothetical protein
VEASRCQYPGGLKKPWFVQCIDDLKVLLSDVPPPDDEPHDDDDDDNDDNNNNHIGHQLSEQQEFLRSIASMGCHVVMILLSLFLIVANKQIVRLETTTCLFFVKNWTRCRKC